MQDVESDHQVEPIPPPDAVPLPPGTYVAIFVGGGIHCGILESGDVACGGRYWQAGRRIPPGPYRFIEAGSQSACGVRADGEIRCWGTSPPSPVGVHRGVEFIQLSFDSGRGCGIDKVGAVRCWGHEEDQENQPPNGVFRRVSVSWVHRCAIAEDTRLVCWGGRFYGHGAPSGMDAVGFTDAELGSGYGCVLANDGRATCWGELSSRNLEAPSIAFRSISAGQDHARGLTDAAEVVCWGANRDGQLDAPAGEYIEVDAGVYFSCVLTAGGDVICWGDDEQALTAYGA
ncbi:MAG: hypothetical protein OXH13_07185 [Chloroflexi bacterium]|nr:hypothetical protein [Chloroflexota bacterium]